MDHTSVTPTTRLLITVAVMTATLIQVLDTTIVNVALPHMEGSLSATPDQISWVLTSYLVASAILMPLTGYFTDTLGQKKYLLISIAGFVLASALCGAAANITQIVLFRLLQGVFGAALVPLSQSILTSVYPPEDRGKAMAIWGVGVMVGPILGPTLGGYLTDIASWRWNFYINVPIGILCLLLSMRVIPDSPIKERKMDWIGLTLISVAIGGAQYFLDRGNHDDWFHSTNIAFAAFLSVMSFLGFLLHSLGKDTKKTVFDLSIFKDRNFTIASSLLSLFGLGLFGGMVIIPLMLEGLFDYPVLTTGLIMAPRGISGLISMIIVGKLIKYVDPRWLILFGTILSGVGMYYGTYYNTDISWGWVVGPILLQGFGLGMVFVPISTVAFSTLPVHSRAEAAGLFSLLRTLGSSVGISIVATVYARMSQTAWNQLGGHINPFNPAVNHYLQPLHLASDSKMGEMVLTKVLIMQSQMVSFVDVFMFITASFVIMIPLIFLIKKTNYKQAQTAPPVMTD